MPLTGFAAPIKVFIYAVDLPERVYVLLLRTRVSGRRC
jgi:hypothetical protein